ncbi:MAG: hypothetical protein JSS66_03045 [Armatimonadetes bacterium]|nr:hypothetical protein [Armatimonadota bacterium]
MTIQTTATSGIQALSGNKRHERKLAMTALKKAIDSHDLPAAKAAYEKLQSMHHIRSQSKLADLGKALDQGDMDAAAALFTSTWASQALPQPFQGQPSATNQVPEPGVVTPQPVTLAPDPTIETPQLTSGGISVSA